MREAWRHTFCTINTENFFLVQGRNPFVFTLLPLMADLLTKEAPERDLRAETSLASVVLVIEDNRDLRDSLKTLIGLLGHRVEVAADGVEGLKKALELRPRVALIDIGLPRLDGYQVARRLRAAFARDAVLVAYTAYGDPEDRLRALEAGFDLHLVKPLDWGLFTPWLAQALRGA
jgi:CheY-like chemotaxis protein